MERPSILKTCNFHVPEIEQQIYEIFEIHDLPPDEAGRADLLSRVGPRIRGVATNSKGPLNEEMLERLPALEIVSSRSAGHEGIDVAAVARRGIPFLDTSSVLAGDVADMTMALLLASLRGIPRLDRYVRDGKWPAGNHPFTSRVHGRRLGIIGLGQIGGGIARRAAAFDMEIAYFGPRRKVDAPYRYFDSPTELAAWCEILALACPGGPATRHLVNADVIAALGPEGWLINAARGSVVDTAALIAALESGRLQGAGLDVFENEPNVPAALLASELVVLAPHHGASTRETKLAQDSIALSRLVDRLLPDGRRG